MTFGTIQNKLTYSIYNLSGHLIKTETQIQKGEKYIIDISDVETGLYFLEVNGMTTKIIKVE